MRARTDSVFRWPEMVAHSAVMSRNNILDRSLYVLYSVRFLISSRQRRKEAGMNKKLIVQAGTSAHLKEKDQATLSVLQTEASDGLPRVESERPVGVKPLDIESYRVHVAHLGLSAEKETELLVTVWRMMGSFVDRAFGDDPVQHVNEMRSRDETRRSVVVGLDKVQPQTDDASLSSAFSSPAAASGSMERP